MKKILLPILLLLAPAFAQAEWVELGETSDAVIYIDPATIRKDGNFRKAWDLSNRKKRDKDGTMSIRGLGEYDCKEERTRTLSWSTHSETMAGGKTLDSNDDPKKWAPVPPQTGGERLLKFVCAK